MATPEPQAPVASQAGLAGAVKASAPGALGFDSDTVLTAGASEAFVAAGFSFAIRYLSLAPTPQGGDLTAAEANAILQSGLALMAVQHVLDPGWAPTQALGQEFGQYAVANAQAVGFPNGVNVWLDLEGVAAGVSATDVIGYCNAWFTAVAAAGYVPGLYVGADAVLNGDQLYYDLQVQYYWKSGSDVPNVTGRGYCMVQTISASFERDGVSYDQDIIETDNLGHTPLWLIAPSLPATVQVSTASVLGFDSDTVLTAGVAEAFVTAGFRFAIRYLSLAPTQQGGDLTTAEAEAILQSGLALMAVQHPPNPGWSPTQVLGREYGQYAAANAQALGFPKGVNVWLDLEGVAAGVSAADVIGYCNAWFAAVSAAGYVPGLYVGADAVLSGDELYYNLQVEYYWKSGSDVPSVTERGYCMVQTISASFVLDGVAYDQDAIQADNLGHMPLWLVAPQPEA